MLAFISDMANYFGKDIKNVCDKELVQTIITKLRNFRVKRYESDIIGQEQVILFIFYQNLFCTYN
jgi:hypothetical protein